MTPELIPPRVPQYNWVDLGLPSGTLWLDRMVGAPSPSEPGLFYQWGDIVGHAASEGYNFSASNYGAKGLGLITTDLDEAHDGARAYYGPAARIPSEAQMQELIDNCLVTIREGDVVLKLTSRINGNSITIKPYGRIRDLERHDINRLIAWTSTYLSQESAITLHSSGASLIIADNTRLTGCNLMAVHS